MKALYVIGNSGLAKEVYELSQHLNDFEFKGFIDYKPENKITEICGVKIQVFDEDEFLVNNKPESGICLAIGIGDPNIIHKVTDKFSGYDFPNLIHPKAVLNKNFIRFGKGNIFTANVVFTADTTVGNYNIFNLSTTIGHDVVIGNCNVINPAVNISGGVVIGDRNLLGVGSIILQYKSIGNDCTIGGASLVTKNVMDGDTVVGVPAKKYVR